MGEGETWIIVEISTKQKPTSLKLSFEMQHLDTAPKPASLRLFNRGVLSIAHIAGVDSFLWSSPRGDGLIDRSHMSPP